MCAELTKPVHRLSGAPIASDDPWLGDDEPLALTLCHELHYRGLAGVDDAWEWEPSLVALRQRLEASLLDRVAADVDAPARDIDPADADVELRALASDGGPSLSAYVERNGTVAQLREFAIHRSIYQLKEADPHSFAIPRVTGVAKAALVAIQRDEYGDGRPADMHATLFANTMRALDLDSRYGAYLDVVPGVTLSTVNLVTLFGLNRRWLGALVGHLALFEMASVVPNGRYANALRRLGFGQDATAFYDAHVRADAVHEDVARRDLVGGLLRDRPDLAADVVFGARALSAVEAAFTEHLLASWRAGASSLRVRDARAVA